MSHNVSHKTKIVNYGSVLSNKIHNKPYYSNLIDSTIAKRYKEYFQPIEKENQAIKKPRSSASRVHRSSSPSKAINRVVNISKVKLEDASLHN